MTKEVTPIRSVLKAAESGDRRELLVALRDRLWAAVHDERTQARDLSPLTLRLKELDAEIRELDLREAEDVAHAEHLDTSFDPDTL